MKMKKEMGIQSVPRGVCIGIFVSLLVTLIGIGVISWMLSGEKMTESTQDYGVVLILLLSSATGVGTALSISKSKRLVVSILVGGGYYLLLLACTALFFGGQYQGVGVTALVILAGCIGTVLVGQLPKKKRAVSRHKYKNR